MSLIILGEMIRNTTTGNATAMNFNLATSGGGIYLNAQGYQAP
jgi:hypothetical protein